MQFPVPQFTDVEDKIIGPLTIKQFGILFAVGVVVFLSYSTTKSIVVGVFFLLVFGLPGLGVAFYKPNGRPMYNAVGYFIKFFTSPKLLVFHKEIQNRRTPQEAKDALNQSVSAPVSSAVVDPQADLKRVQELLARTAREESDVANKMR